VSSWRDIASPQAQEDLDGLLAAAIDFAQQQLASHGEFFPFAAAVRTDGSAEMIHARPDTADERPPASQVIDACVATLTHMQAELSATAITADVRVAARNDAIQVELEHADGHALTVVLPYVKRHRNRIDYAPIRATAGQHRIWPPPDR